MFRHILCPVDLAERTAAAEAMASALAQCFGARLTGLFVRPDELVAVGEVACLAPPPPLTEDEHRAIEVRIRERFPGATGDGVLRALVAQGGAADEIVAQAGHIGAELIVMGTHGRRGFDRWVAGSVTERVLHRAACPVLTVSPRLKLAAAETPIRRIVCAESLSHPSRASEYAIALARELKARMVMVHAVEEQASFAGEEWPSRFGPQMRAAAEGELADTIEGLADVRTKTVVMPGRPHEVILRCAREHEADLIVLGVHDRTAADLALLGSTARHVVRQAECPVLAVPGNVVRSLVKWAAPLVASQGAEPHGAEGASRRI